MHAVSTINILHLLCRYYLGQLPIIVIKDLDILKEVTVKQFEQFHDRPPAPDLLRKKSGTPRGLFNARGAYWKKIRVTLSPSFSASKMKMVHAQDQKKMHTCLHNITVLHIIIPLHV